MDLHGAKAFGEAIDVSTRADVYRFRTASIAREL